MEVGRTVQLDADLSLATTAETVTVTGESPVIDTLRASSSTQFNNELVENVPTTRSSYFDLISYAPESKPIRPRTLPRSVSMARTPIRTPSNTTGSMYPRPTMAPPGTFPTSTSFRKSRFSPRALPPSTAGSREVWSTSSPNREATTGTERRPSSSSMTLSSETAPPTRSFPINRLPADLHPTDRRPDLRDKLWFFAALELTRNRNSQVGVDPKSLPAATSGAPTSR